MGRLSNKIILGLLTLAFLSTGGAFGAWVYSGMAPNPTNQDVGIDIEEWYYNFTPEEGDPDYVPNADHNQLLQNIIKQLNDTSGDSKLWDAINERLSSEYDDVSSIHNIQGGNLKKIVNQGSVKELGFVIHFDSDTKYAIYSFIQSDVEGNPVGSKIVVYKTYAIKKESGWILSGGYKGYADVSTYKAPNNDGGGKPAIDEHTWKEGEIPTT